MLAFSCRRATKLPPRGLSAQQQHRRISTTAPRQRITAAPVNSSFSLFTARSAKLQTIQCFDAIVNSRLQRRSFADSSERRAPVKKPETHTTTEKLASKETGDLTEKERLHLWQRTRATNFKHWREGLDYFLGTILTPGQFGYRWPLIPPDVEVPSDFPEFNTSFLTDEITNPNPYTLIPVAPENGSTEHERIIIISWDKGIVSFREYYEHLGGDHDANPREMTHDSVLPQAVGINEPELDQTEDEEVEDFAHETQFLEELVHGGVGTSETEGFSDPTADQVEYFGEPVVLTYNKFLRKFFKAGRYDRKLAANDAAMQEIFTAARSEYRKLKASQKGHVAARAQITSKSATNYETIYESELGYIRFKNYAIPAEILNNWRQLPWPTDALAWLFDNGEKYNMGNFTVTHESFEFFFLVPETPVEMRSARLEVASETNPLIKINLLKEYSLTEYEKKFDDPLARAHYHPAVSEVFVPNQEATNPFGEDLPEMSAAEVSEYIMKVMRRMPTTDGTELTMEESMQRFININTELIGAREKEAADRAQRQYEEDCANFDEASRLRQKMVQLAKGDGSVEAFLEEELKKHAAK